VHARQAFSLEETFYARFDTHAKAAAAIRRKQAVLGSVSAGVSFGLAFYMLALIYCTRPSLTEQRSHAQASPRRPV